MKITVTQLRRIIREEVERLTEAPFQSRPGSFAFGDSPDPQDVHDEFLMWRDKNGVVPLEKLAKELGVDPNRIDWNGTGLRVVDGVVTELLGDTPHLKAPFQSRPGSLARGDSPDPQDVHDAFLNLRDPYGQYRVLETDIAEELGVKPEQIDYNGTGLRVMDGVVTELLGGTPYRTDR